MNTVKYFLILFLFFSGTVFAQSGCPNVIASSSNSCSSSPVQLNASAGFTTYSWSPTAGLSNPNISNPIAAASGTYTVTASTYGPNLIANPDFSLGNTGFTSGQTYSTTYQPCNYYVDAIWFGSYFPGLPDHTPTADNFFMDIDGCTSSTFIWQETVSVTPNTNYAFSYWASEADQVQPIFEMHFIGNATGNNVLNTVPGIPYSGVFTWDQYGVPAWNSGANTSVTLQVVNLQTNGYGNDFGLDDFSFQQLCLSTDSVQVTIAQPPSLGSDTTMCNNTTLLLDAGNADSYLWNTNQTTQTINVNASGQYIVNAATNNCVFSDTINVSVILLPPVNLGADTLLCAGGFVELSASGSPQSTYLWNTGSTNPTILADATGTYSVVVSASNCSTNDSIHITVAEPVNLGNDISLCGTLSQQLDAGHPGATYLWSTGSTDQIINVDQGGEYWVQVNEGTCSSTDTIEASGELGEGILFIPNTFTPNENSVNDKFNAYGTGISSFDMKIFDRWGQLIFETKDLNEGWDGKYKGRIAQIDTYVYVIDYKTECSGTQTKKEIGHVNLIK